MMKNCPLGFLSASILFLSLQAAVQAEILLTVDISDPMAVRFTATEAASSATGLANISSGITLLGLFFNQYANGDIALAEQTLFANGASLPYATASVVYYQLEGIGRGYDLNLYGAPLSYQFVQGAQAFTGEALLTFYAAAPDFASVGTIGDIVLGYSQSNGKGTVIGQFQVIPEPSSLMLLAFSPFLIGFARWKAIRGGVACH